MSLPNTIGEAWQRLRESDREERLPRAYPPHNAVFETSASYARRSGMESPSGSAAFIRVVVAQDRRDLLAFHPIHAMRRGGWEPDGSQQGEHAWRTRHVHTEDFLTEFIELDTVYVVPGFFGPRALVFESAAGRGPGWPGPGALVQVLVTAPGEAEAEQLRAAAIDLAQQLADDLARRVATVKAVTP
jgi:hypothetical protein